MREFYIKVDQRKETCDFLSINYELQTGNTLKTFVKQCNLFSHRTRICLLFTKL
jgi:hypothetical protein